MELSWPALAGVFALQGKNTVLYIRVSRTFFPASNSERATAEVERMSRPKSDIKTQIKERLANQVIVAMGQGSSKVPDLPTPKVESTVSEKVLSLRSIFNVAHAFFGPSSPKSQ